MDRILKKLFDFDCTKTSVRTEILAGLTTFLTMAYILSVNPAMFSALDGMPASAAFTATALAAVIGTLVMAFYAKMPFGLAPGMGLNAFFVYTICLGMGYSWQFALTAVFLEGWLFVILTICNIRDLIIKAIPQSMRAALSIGLGLFIAMIGLINAGVIVDDPATLIRFGDIYSSGVFLALAGIIISGILLVLKVPGALFLGIIITTLLGIPMGVTHYGGLVSMPGNVASIFCKFEWSQIFSVDMAIVLFTFLFLDMFDTVGTLVGVCTKCNMTNKDGSIPKLKRAFMADAVATVAGAMFGTCTTTTYVESSAGISAGGRSGLTSFVIAMCFVLSLFFSPIFLAIPTAATSPVLVIVGMMMMTPIKNIDFENYGESIPAFVCMIMIPLTYSVSKGLSLGIVSYVVINILCGKYKQIPIGTYVLAALFIAGLLIV